MLGAVDGSNCCVTHVSMYVVRTADSVSNFHWILEHPLAQEWLGPTPSSIRVMPLVPRVLFLV